MGTYTDALLAVNETLVEVLGELRARPAQGRERDEEITRRQDEMLGLLREMNGHQREQAVVQATQGQWMEDHKETHKELEKQVDRVSTRSNVVDIANGLLAAAFSLAAAIFNSRSGK